MMAETSFHREAQDLVLGFGDKLEGSEKVALWMLAIHIDTLLDLVSLLAERVERLEDHAGLP